MRADRFSVREARAIVRAEAIAKSEGLDVSPDPLDVAAWDRMVESANARLEEAARRDVYEFGEPIPVYRVSTVAPKLVALGVREHLGRFAIVRVRGDGKGWYAPFTDDAESPQSGVSAEDLEGIFGCPHVHRFHTRRAAEEALRRIGSP